MQYYRTKNPYIPVNVYKALLKFALSILPGEKVKQELPKALAFLADKAQIKQGAALSWYVLPFNSTLPFYVLIFKKRNVQAYLPTYMTSFYFNNYIINLPLLMNENDVWENGECKFILPPPYFANDLYLSVPVQSYAVRDLSSAEKVADEWEELIFTLASLEHSWAYVRQQTDQNNVHMTERV